MTFLELRVPYVENGCKRRVVRCLFVDGVSIRIFFSGKPYLLPKNTAAENYKEKQPTANRKVAMNNRLGVALRQALLKLLPMKL